MKLKPFGTGLAFVTGARGFFGRHVVDALAVEGWRVAGIGYANDDGPEVEGLDQWHESIVDAGALVSLIKEAGRPDLVMHMAGGSSVGFSIANPREDFEMAVRTTEAVTATLKEHAPKAVVLYPSSAAVYGESGIAGPISVTTPAAPVSPYGHNKFLAEERLHAAHDLWGLHFGIIRFFSLYGPGLRKQLLWDIRRKLKEDPTRLALLGSGEETRDFMHVEDAVRLLAHVAERARTEPTTVNGGTGRASTVREVAELMIELAGADAEPEFSGTRPPGDPEHLIADVSTYTALGFATSWRLKDGLRDFVEWADRSEKTA